MTLDVVAQRLAFVFETIVILCESSLFVAPELRLAHRVDDAPRQGFEQGRRIEQPGGVLAVGHQVGKAAQKTHRIDDMRPFWDLDWVGHAAFFPDASGRGRTSTAARRGKPGFSGRGGFGDNRVTRGPR